MRRIFAILKHWPAVSRAFWRGAPVRHWHRYFASCWRMAKNREYIERRIAGCSDVWELGVVRAELMREALERFEEHQAAEMKRRGLR